MRSKLFVPATRPSLWSKALSSRADAICLDLEDGVATTEKAVARKNAVHLLDEMQEGHNKTVMVRVNGLDTPHLDADLDAVVRTGVHVINLPKAETPDDIRELADRIAQLARDRSLPNIIGIVANIESPTGLNNSIAIAGAHSTMVGLQLGFGDLFEPLGIDRRDSAATSYVQMQVRLAAGQHGIAAYDAAYADIQDLEGYCAQAAAARRLGYTGKTCIHPSQIDAANAAFQPSAAELEFASLVVDAWREAEQTGIGAITVKGKMIDKPFAIRAQALLAQAGRE